jgi:hypothetical protein
VPEAEVVALPVAAVLAAVVVAADTVRVPAVLGAAPAAIKPKARPSRVIKPRVRLRIKLRAAVAAARQLLRGNLASPACLAMCLSNR